MEAAMEIKVQLDGDELIPDHYAKHADAQHLYHGMPTTSFPFEVTGIPEDAESLAVTFTDYDSIPVCGFTWIHWTAAGIDASFAKDGVLAFPEDASNQQAFGMVQGMNSSASRLGVSSRDPLMMCRYNGPQPPDTTHVYTLRAYALDIMPDLKEGFLLNELVRILRAHTISWAEANLPARS